MTLRINLKKLKIRPSDILLSVFKLIKTYLCLMLYTDEDTELSINALFLF